MLNYLWGFMLLIGMIWGVVTGRTSEVIQGLLDAAKDGVSLGITMLGILSFWSGILEVGNKAGLLEWLTEKMTPFLNFLFPQIDADHPARTFIATNMVANVLGLGWAATPAGLEAMKQLKKTSTSGDVATKEMCTFLILNISSLQLIPINMIAYRSEYGSVNPSAVIVPALIATTCSTVAAIVFCKVVIS